MTTNKKQVSIYTIIIYLLLFLTFLTILLMICNPNAFNIFFSRKDMTPFTFFQAFGDYLIYLYTTGLQNLTSLNFGG